MILKEKRGEDGMGRNEMNLIILAEMPAREGAGMSPAFHVILIP